MCGSNLFVHDVAFDPCQQLSCKLRKSDYKFQMCKCADSSLENANLKSAHWKSAHWKFEIYSNALMPVTSMPVMSR